MKKFNLLLAVCLGMLAFAPAWSDDASDIARAAKRGTTSPTVTTTASTTTQTRGRIDTPTTGSATVSGASRTNVTASSTTSQRPDTTVTTTTTRDRSVINQASRETAGVVTDRSRSTVPTIQSVANRATIGTTATPSARTGTVVNSSRGSARTAIQTPTSSARSGVVRPTGAAARSATTTASSANRPSRTGATNISRAAATGSVVGSNPIGQDYKKCRTVFYECMDEFCANKDTQLKRCACSARIHDFDGIRKQMEQVEEKMLDFNERLLTVNMDKEDALAISSATEGELAFNKEDKSDSKKMLDEIQKKLNASMSNAELDRSLSAISLSLDTDSAWDNIDSLAGASTTTKEGTALYNAALPVCREMVAEVCDEDGVAMAESAYLMAIEQDCNTVSKAYDTMTAKALDKVREGSALLDMSRLDIHQTRNSDDILTCKKKMLDMLANNSVCGKDLGKCLDNSGRYIDPSTGEAFLTVNLVNLGNLISRPTGDQKWTKAPGNEPFVQFLNAKKKYLEPAMENCQDIADRVWDEFMEDALAQIKLAQEKKLEDMRQSCTSLTSQCLTTTAKSISEFDARALSVFGVSADKTVNEMCSGVKNACTALLETTAGADTDWVGGMTEIQTDKTYDTIIQTCREVGRACIIQTCKSVSGNFGLCESVDNSVNRKAIINRTSCWNDVVKCVAEAGADPIGRIMTKFGKTPGTGAIGDGGNFYTETYGANPIRTNGGIDCRPQIGQNQNCVFDICYNCGQPGRPDCATCRIAERIWGNCEFDQNKSLEDSDAQNKIKLTKDDDTLLSWFATNTGTAERLDSCRNTACPPGYTPTPEGCVSSGHISSDKASCVTERKFDISIITNPKWTNCCPEGKSRDSYGNCCSDSTYTVTGFVPGYDYSYYAPVEYGTFKTSICTPVGTTGKFVASFIPKSTAEKKYYAPASGTYTVICLGGNTIGEDVSETTGFPSGKTITCPGKFVILNNAAGTYMAPQYNMDPVTKSEKSPNLLTQKPLWPMNSYNIDIIAAPECRLHSEQRVFGTIGAGNVWNPNPTTCNKIDNSAAYPTDNAYPVNVNNNLLISY
ncbi:hypothetical protein LJC18_00155 [Lachnospiraceae bacterium OttesenSCG-928-E19]|nr:hypothetical protein [Lachnospiraceae bacterium OttesenSCG-928-E19]